jgi:hypothetical protein
MKTQWCYEKDGRKYGPVPQEHLRALLATGHLSPDDPVWEAGVANPRLFRVDEALALGGPREAAGPMAEGAPPSGEAPCGPAEGAESGEAARAAPADFSRQVEWVRKKLRAFVEDAAAAGRLAARQAELVKIKKVTLPACYLALGKTIRREGRFREEFAAIHGRLDELAKQLGDLQHGEHAPEEFPSFVDRAVDVATRVACLPKMEALASKARGQLRKLGRLAYESHGADAGPEALIKPLQTALQRCTALEAEIADLTTPQAGKLVTPRHLAIGGMIALAAGGAFLAAGAPKLLAFARPW